MRRRVDHRARARSRPTGRAGRRARVDGGQAAVELALALPIVALVVLGVIQVVIVAGDQLAVELAAREGARAASVAADPAGAAGVAARAATGVGPLDVATSVEGDRVTVEVRHRSATWVGGYDVRARVTMALEPP